MRATTMEGIARLLAITSLLFVSACGDGEDAPSDGGSDDAGSEDAGRMDARIDGGTDDGGLRDGGPSDGAIDDGGTIDGGSDDGGTDGAMPDGGVATASECDENADCTEGDCIELAPGGVRVCETPISEATSCTSSFDECCDSSDCEMGSCYPGPVTRTCGGPAPAPHNVCASDRCATDADCSSGQICIPAEVFERPVRTCFSAACTNDLDCTEEPGGACVVFYGSCCGYPQQLACAYPGDCRTDEDCPDGHCRVVDGRTQCESGPAICPA